MISSDEVILRRINRTNPDAVKALPNDGFRATSFSICERESDLLGPSWSRLSITSPGQLKSLASVSGADPEIFTICCTTVSDVRTLKLDVVASPKPEDPGHCHIEETAKQKFTSKVWSKLAKKTRVLSDEQIGTIQAGDPIG